MGSSPLTRGKRAAELFEVAVEGLIPAHAGKTRSALSLGFRAGAHPRSRGENIAAMCKENGYQGSSPLTRGKPMVGSSLPSSWGLIPAHAGKTGIFDGVFDLPRAHPRSRGENLMPSILPLT